MKYGEHIVTGLSGGPDSVCLFHVLLSLQEEMDLKLYPVHINHKFRPGAAERDQDYVENLCAEHGIRCTTVVRDCGKLAAELGMTDEEAGRKVRYDAFRSVAEEIAAGRDGESPVSPEHIKIAVAQNANDQAETILFRLLRGTGPDGLAGIAYSRSEGRFRVIRPILDITRSEIENYCRDNGLDPVIDHTNSETVYARNRIRLKLLPLLEQEYNPGIMAALDRLGRIAADDRDYLWQQTEEIYRQAVIMENEDAVTLDLAKVRVAHRAIRHRLLMRALEVTGLGSDVTEERLAAADRIIDSDPDAGMKRIQLPHGYEIKTSYGRVICGRSRAGHGSGNDDDNAGFLRNPEKMSANAHKIPKKEHKKLEIRAELTEDMERISEAVKAFAEGRRPAGAAVFDADKLHGDPEEILRSLTIRHRREGDYINLRGGRKKLRKLMIDMKIPADERDSIWLLAYGSEVLRMAGGRYAEVYRPDSSTKRLLIVDFV